MTLSSSDTALVTEDGELSYEQLILRSDELVKDIDPRSLVFMKVENDLDSVAFYIGCIRNRIVPLMVNSDISEEIWQRLLSIYKPEYVWAKRTGLEDGDDGDDTVPYVLSRINEASPALHDDLALLLSTSGSTGSPKLVRLSYENLHSNAKAISEYLSLTSADRAITTLPFGYTYGISVINSHLLSGGSVVLTPKTIIDREFWDMVKKWNVTSLAGVPYTYQMLDKLRFATMDLPSLRYITQAGGRLGEALHEKFAVICDEKGIDFFVMYGQTEATARMSYLPAQHAIDKVGSIGVAIPGGAFALVDEHGDSITDAEVDGELVYTGPNVSMGYAYGPDDLAKGDERNGILHTGDIARRDEDGFYYITGRLSRFLKVYGNRIGLDELETLLSKDGFVVAATGIDDRIELFVEDGDLDEVRRVAAASTGLNPRAFSMHGIERLPRTSAGKISYADLNRICANECNAS